MKTHQNHSHLKSLVVAVLGAAVIALGGVAQAGTVQKANNTKLLNDTASWVTNGTPATPGGGDVAQWDNTVTAANTVGLGAPASWGGILVTNPGGAVTLTNDGNALTLGGSGIDLSATNNGLTLQCPVVLNVSQAWTVFTNRTLAVSNVVSEASAGTGLTKAGLGTLNLYGTNTYTGPTIVNAGTFTMTSGSLAAGSSVKVNTGGSLSLFGSATINGPVEVGTNTTAVQNASISGKIVGNLTIDAGSTNVTPQNAIYTTPASGFAQLNLSASVSAGGYVTNMGVLKLTGNGSQTLGTLIGPGSDAAGNLGGIQDNNTNSKTLTLGSGSAFAYYQPYGGNYGTTLQIVGNGSAYVKWFGYNDTAGMALYTNTLNGGTWTFNSIGQNNSASHYVGVCNVSNSATVYVTNSINYSHGSWIITSNSSMTFNQPAQTLVAGHAANNFGLNLSASNNGTLYAGGSVQLGFGQTTPNTAAESNSLSIGGAGAAYVTNNLTVGVTGENHSNETDVVTLSGGKLVVGGTFAPAGGTLTQTNATPYFAVYPSNIFNWTGGQLTAGTITVSNGLAVTTLTNVTPIVDSVTNPAVFSGGNFSTTTLTNNAGTLAPGDDGIPGRTIISGGGYVQTDGGTLAIDLGGTTRASSFQASTNGNYDYLQVNGSIVLGGSLKVSLVGNYTPVSSDQLSIIASSGAGNLITGTFTNLLPGGGNMGHVAVVGVANATFDVVSNSANSTVYLSNYHLASTTPVAGFSGTPLTGIRPLTVTFTNASTGSFTNGVWNFGDGTSSTTAALKFTHVYVTNGVFTVSLTAQGAGGTNMVTTNNYVTVTIPNSPNLASVTISGGNLVFQGNNGPASTNYNYWLLSSTNLTLPRAQWSVIATNPFNADGSFSNSVTVPSGNPENFYLLQMP